MPWTLRRRPRTVDSSSPSGTRTASAVRSYSPSGARRSSPSAASASRSASWARRWQLQRVGSHSSRTRRSASCEGEDEADRRDVVVRAPPPAIESTERAGRRGRSQQRPGRMRRSSLRSARSPASGVQGRAARRGRRGSPANATSTCASSIRSAWPPSDVAQSRSSSASCSRQRRRARRGAAPPRWSSRRARRRARCSRRPSPRRAVRVPAPARTRPRRGPPRRRRRPARAASRSPSMPATPQTTRSPGSTKFTDRRLHPGAAGAGQRRRRAAVRGERLAQEDLGLVHDRGRRPGSMGPGGTWHRRARALSGRGLGPAPSSSGSAAWSRSLDVQEVLGQVGAQRVADEAALVLRGDAVAREQLALTLGRDVADGPADRERARTGTRPRAARSPPSSATCCAGPLRARGASRRSSPRAAPTPSPPARRRSSSVP